MCTSKLTHLSYNLTNKCIKEAEVVLPCLSAICDATRCRLQPRKLRYFNPLQCPQHCGYDLQLQTPGLAVAPKVEMKKRNKKKNLHGLLKIQKLHELRKLKKKTWISKQTKPWRPRDAIDSKIRIWQMRTDALLLWWQLVRMMLLQPFLSYCAWLS